MAPSKKIKSRTSRRRLKPAARRLEILLAAEKIFRKNGTSPVSVDEIVREAGTAKGTFYLYFPSLVDLLWALRERVFAEFGAKYPAVSDLPPTVNWKHLAEAYAVGFIDFTLQLGGLHRAIFHGHVTLDPMIGMGGARLQIVQFINAGIATGAIAPVDAEPTARLVFAMLHDAVDAIESGEDRSRIVCATLEILSRCLDPPH